MREYKQYIHLSMEVDTEVVNKETLKAQLLSKKVRCVFVVANGCKYFTYEACSAAS